MYSIDDYPQLISGYRDGFFLKTPDDRFSFKIGSRINFGYTYGLIESAADLSSFDLQHVKIYAGGNAYGTTLQYYIQTAAANNTRTFGLGAVSETQEGFVLEDYYIRLQYQGMDFKFGQFKVPFVRQWMIYSGNLDFVHRSLPSQAFAYGRDRGVTLSHYNQWATGTVGVFNGAGSIQGLNPFVLQTGQNASNDTSGGLLYVGRFAFHPSGIAGYSEGDVEQTEGNKIELGGTFVFDQARDFDFNSDNLIDDVDVDNLSASGELVWKREGASLLGEFFYRKHFTSGSDFTAIGFYVQPSYFFIPRKFELAARLGWLNPNRSVGNDRKIEGSGAFNYYFSQDHRFKLQLQYTYLYQDQPINQRMDHFVDASVQVTL